jgi:hypothetical protein
VRYLPFCSEIGLVVNEMTKISFFVKQNDLLFDHRYPNRNTLRLNLKD